MVEGGEWWIRDSEKKGGEGREGGSVSDEEENEGGRGREEVIM